MKLNSMKQEAVNIMELELQTEMKNLTNFLKYKRKIATNKLTTYRLFFIALYTRETKYRIQ